MNLAELRRHRVGVLMSGGLSCTAVGAWLAEHEVDVVAFVADLGQRVPFPPQELAEVLERQRIPTRIVDLREHLADLYLDLVRYQATHDGGYWNTTSVSRATLVAGLAEPLRAAGCTVLVHGCVGGGNDQGRFARYTSTLAPDLLAFSPWAHEWLLEFFPSRQTMADYLLARGFPARFGDYISYSIDGNLGGFSHDSDELERLSTPAHTVSPLMTVWPQAAEEPGERFRLRFVAGCPVAVDDAPVSALRAITLANEIGGRNGISLRSIVENRVNGTKCRGVYEAPGLEVLGHCLAALYQVSLDKAASDLMHALSRQLGRAVYEGRLFDTATQAARAAADLLSATATGDVEVALYRGNIAVTDVRLDAQAPGVHRQTRFGNGGHHWQIVTG